MTNGDNCPFAATGTTPEGGTTTGGLEDVWSKYGFIIVLIILVVLVVVLNKKGAE